MEENTFVLKADDGKEVVCEILFTYHSDEFNKDYVIFQPRGEEQLSAACYIEDNGTSGQLEAIESDEEWVMLEELVDDYYSNQSSGCSGNCGSCSGCDSDDYDE